MRRSDPLFLSRRGQPRQTESEKAPESEASAAPDGSSGGGAYSIGYGKPPRGSRFQPGRSGNPKGRPRGAQAFKTLLQRELAASVSVKENGRRRTLTKRNVIIKRLVSEAMAGSPKHLAIVLAQDPIVAEVIDEVTTALARPADALVKAGLIQRVREALSLQGAPPDCVDQPDPEPEEGSA